MTIHRRLHVRHNVHLTAVLLPIGAGDNGQQGQVVAVHNISMGGVRFASPRPLSVGSIWRLRFRTTSQLLHEVAVLVRSQQRHDGGEYFIGGQYIMEPAFLRAVGVLESVVENDARALMEAGSHPVWEVHYHMMAKEPVSVTELGAMCASFSSDLSVSKSITDCTLDITGRLIAPDAVLDGGTTHVLHAARLGEVGTPESHPTTLVLGQSLVTGTMLAAAVAAHTTLQNIIERKRADMATLNARPPASLGHTDRETLTVIMSELPELEHRLAMIEANSARLRERESGNRLIQLDVKTAIHPGVTIVAADSRVSIVKTLPGPVTLGLNAAGQLDILPTPGAPTRNLLNFTAQAAATATA